MKEMKKKKKNRIEDTIGLVALIIFFLWMTIVGIAIVDLYNMNEDLSEKISETIEKQEEIYNTQSIIIDTQNLHLEITKGLIDKIQVGYGYENI